MKKLLIIEDDLLFCKTLERLFSKYYKLSFCSSEEEFYNSFSSTKYDLILLDISLKGRIDGLQIARDIRKNYLLPEIPIVCLTAHAYHKERRTAVESGVNAFLTKPVDNKVLLAQVESLLQTTAHKK